MRFTFTKVVLLGAALAGVIARHPGSTVKLTKLLVAAQALGERGETKVVPEAPANAAKELSAAELDALQKKFLARVNADRSASFLPTLKLDNTITDWLKTTKSLKGSEWSAKSSMDRFGDSSDFASYWFQNVESGTTDKAIDMLVRSNAVKQRDLNSAGLLAIPLQRGSRSGYEVRLVTGLKAAEFTPEALNDKTHSALITTCPRCRLRYVMEPVRDAESFNLVCRDCGANYSMLVKDNQGDFHYVNDFLIGFQPPAHFRRGLSKQEEMRLIWQGVYMGCEYRSDNRGMKKIRRDTWQTGPETLKRGTGDCDDSSLLLADWLLARGFDARVALGTAWGEGHAWVVTLLEGRTYVLESTAEPPPSVDDLLTAGDLRDEYVPEILFDRDACYYWKDKDRKFDGDYYSIHWSRVAQGQGVKSKPAETLPKGELVLTPPYLRELQGIAFSTPSWQATWAGLK